VSRVIWRLGFSVGLRKFCLGLWYAHLSDGCFYVFCVNVESLNCVSVCAFCVEFSICIVLCMGPSECDFSMRCVTKF
jgi:hypothetical protein